MKLMSNVPTHRVEQNPSRGQAPVGIVRAEISAIQSDGTLLAKLSNRDLLACDWLEIGGPIAPALSPGDSVMVFVASATERGVVLGRVARYPVQSLPVARVTIEATESLSLKCGEASIDLRADGKVMVRGEDVLLRAKGTQRIRAGTVSIN